MKAVLRLTLLLFAIVIIVSCSKDDEIIDVFDLDENEFLVQPSKPNVGDEVKIVTYDCGYNNLISVERDGFNILVLKNFNSAMMQPCVLEHDTISLGQLTAGTYQVTFKIMDLNNMFSSAITEPFHTETKIVVVKN